MAITIDDVPSGQVLNIYQGSLSYLSLYVSGATEDQMKVLQAKLTGTNAWEFMDPPTVYNFSLKTATQYQVVLRVTGTVPGSLSKADASDPDKGPFDPELIVTVTSGPLSSNPFNVTAIYIMAPPNL